MLHLARDLHFVDELLDEAAVRFRIHRLADELFRRGEGEVDDMEAKVGEDILLFLLDLLDRFFLQRLRLLNGF